MMRASLRFSFASSFICAAALSAPLHAAAPPAPAAAPAAAPASAAAPSARAAAEERFFAGQRLYRERRHAQALAAFQASYALVPSPNSRLYIARCLRELGDVAGAYEAYTEVILDAADHRDPSGYAATQRAATEERAALRDRVALVALRVPPEVAGVEVRVGAVPVAPGRFQRGVPVPAGEVTISAGAPGRARFTRTLRVHGGEEHLIVVMLPPVKGRAAVEPAPAGAGGPGALPVLAAVSGGIGVLGFSAFGLFGLRASTRHDALEAACGGRCGPERQGDIDAGRRETLAAQVGLGVGLAGVTSGVALLLAGIAGGGRSSPAAASASAGSPLRLGGTF